MKTLDRYILREMIVPLAAGFLVVLILLVGNIVYNNIGIIVAKIKQWPDLIYYIALQSPYFVVLSLPSGALFGCSLAVSRLTRDSEITMMRMAGISVRRIFLPVFVVGALISLVAYSFQELVTPWADRESVKVLKRLWAAPGDFAIQANVFFRADNYYFYVGKVNRSGNTYTLENVMVYESPVSSGYPTLTTARSARMRNGVWVLTDGTNYRIDRDGDLKLVVKFRNMKLDLRRPVADYIVQEQKSPKGMTIAQLREQIDLIRSSGLDARNYQLEYNYKLAIPLSSLVLVLCVAPLSLRFGKSGGFMGVLIGIIVLFFYWNVILFSRVLGETGGLPPVLAGWSEVIIFTLLGAILMWKAE
ncbi:MAG: LptF/LptG family permease [Armatimonadota bacterium]|nr:LptF/LptG family permease [Armatimonadota bacterium]